MAGAPDMCSVHEREFAVVCPDCYAEAGVVEWREKQRKHECTHGWRNPPSVYEEERSET
jgi:hypothetical protein